MQTLHNSEQSQQRHNSEAGCGSQCKSAGCKSSCGCRSDVDVPTDGSTEVKYNYTDAPPHGVTLTLLTKGNIQVTGQWRADGTYIAWAPLLPRDRKLEAKLDSKNGTPVDEKPQDSTSDTDLPAITKALVKTDALLNQLTIISGSLSGIGLKTLKSFAENQADTAVKEAIGAHLRSANTLYMLGRQQYEEANAESQSLALNFLAKQTGQALPGQLVLPSEDSMHNEIIVVKGVKNLFGTDESWSAMLHVETSPGCTTTRMVRSSPEGMPYWQDDGDLITARRRNTLR